MSRSSKRCAAVYESEGGSFASDTTTFATLRAPLVGMVDTTKLKQNKINPEHGTQRRQERTQFILGTFRESQFTIKFWLPGLGSATSGATAASALTTLLGLVYGNRAVSAANGSTFTGGTASAPTTTASGTFTAGSLCRGGALNDGRGNGQFLAISSHAGNTLNLLTAMDAAPNNGDVLYSADMVYPSESPTGTTIQSVRWLLQTANLQYELHGCVPITATLGGFGFAPGNNVPFVEITYAVAWWRYSTATFPSAVATETHQAAANASGSLFVNDVGTATRAKLTYRDLVIEYTLGVELLYGPGGVNAFQDLVGAVRTSDECRVSIVVDAPDATTSPSIPALATGTTAQHLLCTLNPTERKAMGIYIPSLYIDDVPVQFSDNGYNRLRLTGMTGTGPTTTTDLTASHFRLAFA